MDVHLLLKQDPSSGDSPIFQRSEDENQIIFQKFNTKFDFKSISYPEENVFEKTTLPLITDKFFKNEDSLIITLGPTNSGKSHLLFKSENSIVDQTLRAIFSQIEPLSSNIDLLKKFYPNISDKTLLDPSHESSISSFLYLSVSVFELYNDTFMDLLDTGMKQDRTNISIITDPIDKKLTPRNISKHLVNSYESAHDLIFEGLSNRKTCPTFSNTESSRSHCFIYFNLHKVYGKMIETTRFTIVDLAGLERSKSAGTSGVALKEAGYTNGSLTELGRCLELISMKLFHRTCLRTNKLTRLVLNDYVKNNHPVRILLTLDPFGEEGLVLQSLRYINPIKCQDLQRRTTSSQKARLRTISTNEQLGLTGEIDKLRKNQKLLKSKIHSLETSVIENENRIRSEMYTENEKALSELVIKHKEEISSLAENLKKQTDEKLLDQASCYTSTIDSLNNNLEFKIQELSSLKEQFEETKLKLEESQCQMETLTLENCENEKNFNSTLNQHQTQLEELNVVNEKLQSKIDLLLSEAIEKEKLHVKDTELRVEQQNQIVEELNQKIEEYVSTVKKQESNLGILQNKTLEKESRINQLDEEARELKDQIQTLMNEASEKEKFIQSMEKELENLKQEKTEVTIEAERKVNALKSKYDEILSSARSDYENLKRELDDKTQELVAVNSKFSSEKENFKNILEDKDKEIKSLKINLSQLEAEVRSKTEDFSKKLSEKDLEVVSWKNIKTKNDTIVQQMVDRTKRLENQVNESTSYIKQLEESNSEYKKSVTATKKQLDELIMSTDSLQEELAEKSNELKLTLALKKTVDNELSRLQLLCSDLQSDLESTSKYHDKYKSLKRDYSSIKTEAIKLETENKRVKDELASKEYELSDNISKVKQLTKTVENLEKNRDVSLKQPKTDLDVALSLSKEESINKTPRKSLNILDTDPLDDVGLPSIMSSPIRASSFKIYNDSITDKDNTVTIGNVTSKKKSKAKKLSKKDKLLEHKAEHEKSMEDSVIDSSLSPTKLRPLKLTNNSKLNKKTLESPGNDKTKKRKSTTSPIKPGKRKVRKSLSVDDSLEKAVV